jgi:hypothetical protein
MVRDRLLAALGVDGAAGCLVQLHPRPDASAAPISAVTVASSPRRARLAAPRAVADPGGRAPRRRAHGRGPASPSAAVSGGTASVALPPEATRRFREGPRRPRQDRPSKAGLKPPRRAPAARQVRGEPRSAPPRPRSRDGRLAEVAAEHPVVEVRAEPGGIAPRCRSSGTRAAPLHLVGHVERARGHAAMQRVHVPQWSAGRRRTSSSRSVSGRGRVRPAPRRSTSVFCRSTPPRGPLAPDDRPGVDVAEEARPRAERRAASRSQSARTWS